jgi:hypothetical protein
MGQGGRRRECTRADCPRRVGTSLANRVGQGDYLHQHGPHFALGGDARTDARGRRDTPSRITALSLRSLPTRRDRHRSEQPRIRPKSSRSQSKLGTARSRSGHRDGTNLRILDSGYHRNARKQSERGVSSSVIVSGAGDPPATLAFSRSPDTCGWPRGSQLRAPFPSHGPDLADRPVPVQADALRACRLSHAATANLSSSRRIAGGSKCVSSSRV